MKKSKKIDSRPALSKGQKDALFQSALLDAPIYKLIAQSEISIEHFRELDFYLWCIWEVADRFYKRQQRLPALKELRIELEQRMDDPQDYLDDDVVEDITDFYKELKALDEPPLGKDTAREYLQQFFREKAWRATGHLASAQSKIPVSIIEALDTVKADIAAAESLSAEAIPSPFDQKQYDPLTVTSNLTPYGVPFIDAYLGGGGIAGEVYLLLGPSGSAKTTLSQQLSISLAALQMAKWEHGNKRQSLGMSYFVSYEMPGHEIMARLYANFAQINVQKFLEGAPLAKGLDMSPQDQVLFAKAIEYGVRVPSEKERYEHAKKRLSNNWRLLDYSGMSLNEDDMPNPGKGSGLWPEIANQIAADMESYKRQGKKRHVAGIFIDYIGIMAHRHCQFHDKDPSRFIRLVCAEAPQNARSYLSYRFRCPVLLVHQLNAAAAKLKPGQVADMGDAAESKTMSHNCNAVFVVSQPTQDEHRLVRINRQKGRRMPGMGSVVLQVQGQYARVREVNDLWSWDDLTREFIPQTSMDVRYRQEKEETEPKPMRFDGQEFELFGFES